MHSGVIVQIWSRRVFPKPLRLVSLMGKKPTLASYAFFFFLKKKKKKGRKTNYQPTANVTQLKSLKDKGIGDKCFWREGWAVTCLFNGSSVFDYRITCCFSLSCVSSEIQNIYKHKKNFAVSINPLCLNRILVSRKMIMGFIALKVFRDSCLLLT